VKITRRYFASLACAIPLRAAALATKVSRTPWNMGVLSRTPRFSSPEGFQQEGAKAVFYEGPAWKGKATRIFAWYGVPQPAGRAKHPAIVLVHGGGGTAFPDWVRLWAERGYAAIAMDTSGSVPRPGAALTGRPREWDHHPDGGPPGWGGFDQIDLPAQDQWTYHAVAAVILAHSLLRSFPEVDPRRIGVHGISWGGYLTAIAASIDTRFSFAIPVYGCGFLGDDSGWVPKFQQMGPEHSKKWLDLWDPSRYLAGARTPFLWVSGTNDFAYPLPSLQKSYRLPPGRRTLSVRVRMPHGHDPGARLEEFWVFADSITRRTAPLTRVAAAGYKDGKAWAKYSYQQAPIERVDLNFTRDSAAWTKRRWQTIGGTTDAKKRIVSGMLPDDATAWYLNLIDNRGLVVSTEHADAGSVRHS
jgi:dienelactone hydrolase